MTDLEAKRARRIRDLERMKARALRFRPFDPKARTAEHLAKCSGPCCGNPRRWFGELTVQEKRALHAEEID